MAARAEALGTCEKVGEAQPDIAGIGILLGFSAQAFITLALSIWVILLSKLGRLGLRHEEGTEHHEKEKKRLEMISDILMIGNDIQMLLGLALIITGFGSAGDVDLYHLHLIFDTVSFVGISNCAALVCWTFIATILGRDDLKRPLNKKARRTPRHRITYLYAIIFLVLTILLGVRLDEWTLESEELGYCYKTAGLTSWGASHPTADKVYVAVTATWQLLVMFGAVFVGVRYRKILLILSALQFPVHLYMMIALRVANQNSLEGEEDENGWDFGQTTAVLLLGATISELIEKFREYRRFEKELKQLPGMELHAVEAETGRAVLLTRRVREGLQKIHEMTAYLAGKELAPMTFVHGLWMEVEGEGGGPRIVKCGEKTQMP